MVEGQSGLTWPGWQRICLAAESLGFDALYRSDHLVSAQPPNEDTLELFTSLTWLASHTSRLEFGPLVSPLTFRHPVHLAQSARSLDELSGGRFILGLGAGWSRREHHMYGFEMYSPKDRMDRLEEGLGSNWNSKRSISVQSWKDWRLPLSRRKVTESQSGA